MKTTKGQETCIHILEVAEQLFAEKSISRVTVHDIVQRAGVAKGTFYLYFDSKEALVWRLMDHKFEYANQWIKSIVTMGYSDEEISEIIGFIVLFVKKHQKILKIMHHVRFQGFLGARRLDDKYLKSWLTPFSLWLERGRLEGALKINDSQFMAYFLIITLHELFDRVILDDFPLTVDELGNELKTLIIKILK